jgi:hypothetical protein
MLAACVVDAVGSIIVILSVQRALPPSASGGSVPLSRWWRYPAHGVGSSLQSGQLALALERERLPLARLPGQQFLAQPARGGGLELARVASLHLGLQPLVILLELATAGFDLGGR